MGIGARARGHLVACDTLGLAEEAAAQLARQALTFGSVAVFELHPDDLRTQIPSKLRTLKAAWMVAS